MLDSSYTDAGSLKELFEFLRLRNFGLNGNVLECLLHSLTTRERSLSVPPAWCLYLTESGPCPLVLETAAGRCDLDEVRVKVWSHHPPYGDNLVEYLEPRCKNSAFPVALAQLAADMREFNIIVDEPLSRYPKTDGAIVQPPLSGRVRRKMDGFFVEAPYGELIPAERFGVRVPTDAERAALRNEDKEPPDPKPPASAPCSRRGRKPYDIWDPMFDHLDSRVKERGKPFETCVEAAGYGLEFLQDLAEQRRKQGKGTVTPALQTIAEKISEKRPDLVIG